MLIALIHWRIKPTPEDIDAFVKHWKTMNSIPNRDGLIGEFLSNSLPIKEHPYITWHLDAESLGNFKSYVTAGIWRDANAFQDQVAQYFNDEKEMLPFEKYRRRRVVFEPVEWRVGAVLFPERDSAGVL